MWQPLTCGCQRIYWKRRFEILRWSNSGARWLKMEPCWQPSLITRQRAAPNDKLPGYLYACYNNSNNYNNKWKKSEKLHNCSRIRGQGITKQRARHVCDETLRLTTYDIAIKAVAWWQQSAVVKCQFNVTNCQLEAEQAALQCFGDEWYVG